MERERGKVLYDIIDNHIKQLGDNGLSIIDAATGYGKSYQARNYIVNNCLNRRFIFIAPQKKLFLEFKNKDFDGYTLMNEKLGEEAIIIDLLPPLDTFLEYFESIECDLFYEISNVSRLKKIVSKIKKTSSEDRELYVNFFNDEEILFRRELRKLLKNDKAFKKNKNIEGLEAYNKKEIIAFFSKYNWIKKLYPAVLLPYANVAQMTVHKSYYPIDTLWFGHHELSNAYDQLFRDYIIFIDEFDSSKEIIQNTIISNVANNDKVNLFSLIKKIYSVVHNVCLNNILPSDFFAGKKEEIESLISNFYNEIKEIYDKYNLKSALRFIHNESKDRFLFRDKNTIDVIEDNKTKALVLKYSDVENVNYLEIQKGNNDTTLENICNEISRLIEEFIILLSNISRNYFQQNRNRKRDGEEVYSIYEAISTIVTEFNFGQAEHNYFCKTVYRILTYNYSVKKEMNGDFLDFGFNFFCMENEPSHELSTNVYYFHFNEIPEHYLLGLTRNNIVVGLSATATLESYVKNYDSHYLCKKLKDKYIQINSIELEKLKKDFVESTKHNVKIVPITKENDLNVNIFNEKICYIDDYFKQVSLNEIFNTIYINGDLKYRLENYLNLIKVFKSYCENQIHGIMCFLNFNIESTLEFNFKKFKEIFEEYACYKGHICKIYSLSSDNFEEKYEEIKKELKDTNVFIVSTYKTLALGKNLQYEVLGDKKDLDAVYLDKISYVLPNVEKNKLTSLAEYLYCIEYLRYERIIEERKDFIEYIKKGFKKFLTGKGLINLSKKFIRAKDAIISKYSIQSIGRICRTDNKEQNVYIFIHQEVANSLGRMKCILQERMINYEFKELLNSIPNPKNANQEVKYYLENYTNNLYASRKIFYLSFRWWNELKKSEWIELREMVLRFPTRKEVDNNNIYYVQFDEDTNMYSYQIKRLSQNNLLLYNLSKSNIYDGCSKVVSIGSSRFMDMLKSHYVYEYCVNNGYATEFVNNKYILNPSTFERVYKGAVGEIAGKAILEAKGIKISEITNYKYFEKFDYCNGDVYFDMKNWNGEFAKVKNDLLPKIIKKAESVGAKAIFIINILKNDYLDTHHIIYEKDYVYEIPWLYDPINNQYNEEAIELIKGAVLKYGDINE